MFTKNIFIFPIFTSLTYWFSFTLLSFLIPQDIVTLTNLLTFLDSSDITLNPEHLSLIYKFVHMNLATCCVVCWNQVLTRDRKVLFQHHSAVREGGFYFEEQPSDNLNLIRSWVYDSKHPWSWRIMLTEECALTNVIT